MVKRILAGGALLGLFNTIPTAAQELPPGFVDPTPLLAAVAEEIGEANLRCIRYSGDGYNGAVGQTFENAVNIDWPRRDALTNYTRTINWDTGTSIETFDRQPGLNPASWKYGLGWVGGTPTQQARRQTHIVNGNHAWHIDGDGPPVAVPPEIAEIYQLDMWLNPHGFLKAARLPGANPVAFWRWEQLEKGRDGNVVAPEKMHVVAITMLGKYRVDATINSQNQIQRIKTTVDLPALGDFNIEHESTDQETFGDVKWPIRWHSHQGWDDNWQFYRKSTGHNAYGGVFPNVEPNVCGDPAPVPPAIAAATFETAVTVEEIADGVYLLGGGPANSYMVEFEDFVAVFEAPGDEERSLAVIERIVSLAPGKPIRWMIVSHPHFDHIGGLRTYLHIGSTIVTHMINLEFLNHDVLSYEPRTVKPDIVSMWPPTELAEGYNYEAVQENYVITDDSRILRLYYVQPLQHVAGMLMAYLPRERIAFQADLFDTHEPPKVAQLPAMRSLFNQVERMGLDVDTLAPVHGQPIPWREFVAALGVLERNASLSDCPSEQGLTYLCGFVLPEDVVNVGSTGLVLASGHRAPGHMYLIDPASGTWSELIHGTTFRMQHDTNAYPGCPGPVNLEAFDVHGISLTETSPGRFSLYTTSHGEREAIEIYELDVRGASPALTWTGCVLLQQDGYFNSVARLADGGFVTTRMRDRNASTDSVRGTISGRVFEWHPGGELQALAGTELSLPNGIEVSPDGRYVYVAASGTQELVRFDRRATPVGKRTVSTPMGPDNIHWDGNGKLLIAGPNRADPASCDGAPCRAGWAVIEVDPQTLAISRLGGADGTAAMQRASAAIRVGSEIWVGSNEDRIARFPVSGP